MTDPAPRRAILCAGRGVVDLYRGGMPSGSVPVDRVSVLVARPGDVCELVAGSTTWRLNQPFRDVVGVISTAYRLADYVGAE